MAGRMRTADGDYLRVVTLSVKELRGVLEQLDDRDRLEVNHISELVYVHGHEGSAVTGLIILEEAAYVPLREGK